MHVAVRALFKAIEEKELTQYDTLYLLVSLATELGEGPKPEYTTRALSHYLDVPHDQGEMARTIEFYKN
jgi:hypothetical protein